MARSQHCEVLSDVLSIQNAKTLLVYIIVNCIYNRYKVKVIAPTMAYCSNFYANTQMCIEILSNFCQLKLSAGKTLMRIEILMIVNRTRFPFQMHGHEYMEYLWG